jgi:hypothetical protein
MIQEEIRNLLEAPPSGDDAPSLDYIEHTLTAGYATALALEAERWRLERKIAELAQGLTDESGDLRHSELAETAQRLSESEGDLTKLRALLSSLRTRADQVRLAS